MKPKKPPEEDFDYEEIHVGRKKLGNILKQAFSAKPTHQESPPSELFSPEQSVGKDGLEKYISEVKQHNIHASKLKKQKGFGENYDSLNGLELHKNNQAEKSNCTHSAEEKYTKNRKKVGSRELKKVVKKYSSADVCGEGVGDAGLQEFLGDISKNANRPREIALQCKEPETQTAIVPLNVDSPDDISVRKASKYDSLRDPIPNFEVLCSSTTPTKNSKTYPSDRNKEEKSVKAMRGEMRNKVYNQEAESYVGGAISTSDMPVGREGLAHYIKRDEPADAETSNTNIDEDTPVQNKAVLNKELFMKSVIVFLLITAIIVVGLVMQELHVL